MKVEEQSNSLEIQTDNINHRMVYVQVFRLSLDDSDDSISYSLGNSINNSLQKDKSHWADSSKQRPFSYTYASCYPVLNGQCVPKDGFYI